MRSAFMTLMWIVNKGWLIKWMLSGIHRNLNIKMSESQNKNVALLSVGGPLNRFPAVIANLAHFESAPPTGREPETVACLTC